MTATIPLLLRRLGKALLWLVLLLLALLAGLRAAAAWGERETARPAGLTAITTPLGVVTVAISGPPAGQPVVIVPGTAGWSGFWCVPAAHLARRGFRVIAVDLPPFGYSDYDPAGRYDRTTQAARLAAVIDRAAGGRPAIVVAHSFGAGAATELALRAPGRVKQLILVDAALGAIDPPAGGDTLPRLIDRPWLAEPLVSATLSNPLATGALMRTMLARKNAADPWIATIRQPLSRRGATPAYARWAPSLFAADDGARSRTSAGLRAMRPPSALIWGAADSVTPPAQARRLARLIGARATIMLPGVGHVPHIEAPGDFLRALDAAIVRIR